MNFVEDLGPSPRGVYLDLRSHYFRLPYLAVALPPAFLAVGYSIAMLALRRFDLEALGLLVLLLIISLAPVPGMIVLMWADLIRKRDIVAEGECVIGTVSEISQEAIPGGEWFGAQSRRVAHFQYAYGGNTYFSDAPVPRQFPSKGDRVTVLVNRNYPWQCVLYLASPYKAYTKDWVEDLGPAPRKVRLNLGGAIFDWFSPLPLALPLFVALSYSGTKLWVGEFSLSVLGAAALWAAGSIFVMAGLSLLLLPFLLPKRKLVAHGDCVTGVAVEFGLMTLLPTRIPDGAKFKYERGGKTYYLEARIPNRNLPDTIIDRYPTITGKRPYAPNPLKVGDAVTILVDPQDPFNSILYFTAPYKAVKPPR